MSKQSIFDPSPEKKEPELSAPTVVWASFCADCGLYLEDDVVHVCVSSLIGVYCSQCGQLNHAGRYVCAPDPRRAPSA